MSELHLIVLWELAREQESRILADIPKHLDLVHTEILRWPCDPATCYGRFYGANLKDVQCKVRTCGSGPFRIVIARDRNPVYGLRETSRGLERVNVKLFDLKMRYRSWTGGGHRVHTTNSSEEARRDVLLITGRPLDVWAAGRPAGSLTVLPGQGGWADLRSLFAFLGTSLPYAVLRNAETLPDRFDPTLHGDIDLLVPDDEACAYLLGARKVFPQPYRVHYEVQVGGRPVRFDFRHVGDGYYDSTWERDMLERRIARDGIFVLAPEDAFFALLYHALYQKREIAEDYPAKLAALADAAGVPGGDLDGWLPRLEAFLDVKGYSRPMPQDKSVFWNVRLVEWKSLADEIADLSGVTDLRPFRVIELRAGMPLRTFFFSGRFEGRSCFVKYSPVARSLTAAEWRQPQLARQQDEAVFVRPLLWHVTKDGGAFVVQEMINGRPLSMLLRSGDAVLAEKGETIVSDLVRIAEALGRAGIVHRDIRPANLLVGDDGHVTLIDFQFAIARTARSDDDYVQDNPRIAYVLGEGYALAHGQWNDVHAICQVLRQLPPSAVREAALARLQPLSLGPTRVASCSRRMMKWMRRRLARLRRRKFAAFFLPSARARLDRRFEVEFETLSYAVSHWRVKG